MDDAQIIQDLIEGARRAGATVQFQSSSDFYKTAGAAQALADMGMKKEAVLGFLGRKALPWLWRQTAGRAVGATARPLSWMGQRVTGAVGQVSPGAARFLTNIGRGAGREAAAFGLLGGGLEAAMADPGERLSAFGRGFAGGALGGAAWRMGGNLARRGMFKALGRQRYMGLRRASQQGGWTTLRGLGGKAAIGAPVLAGSLGASMMMPTFQSPQQKAQLRQQGVPVGTPYYPGLVYGTGRQLSGF